MGKKYKLPKFPPKCIPTFEKLRHTVSQAEIEEVKKAVTERMGELQEKSQTNPRINLKLANALAERSLSILELYASSTSEQQALIFAAVAYFAIAEDPLSDEAFASGFNDDVAVMNYVLEELGIEDQYIDLV